MIELDDRDLQKEGLQKLKLQGASLQYANLQGISLKKVDWRGVNLNCANLTEIELTKANLSGANLSGASLAGGSFYKVDFRKANLEGANLKGAKFVKCNFKSSQLKGVCALHALFEKCSFKKTDLSFADLKESSILKSKFKEADFYSAEFSRAEVEKSYFRRPNLERSSLSQADLINTTVIEVGVRWKIALFSSVGVLLAGLLVFWGWNSRGGPPSLEELRSFRSELEGQYRENIREEQKVLAEKEQALKAKIKRRLKALGPEVDYLQASKDPQLSQYFNLLSLLYLRRENLKNRGEEYKREIGHLDRLIFLARNREKEGEDLNSTRWKGWKKKLRKYEYQITSNQTPGMVREVESKDYVKKVFQRLKNRNK